MCLKLHSKIFIVFWVEELTIEHTILDTSLEKQGVYIVGFMFIVDAILKQMTT